jgi:hypothetical protein
MNEGSPVVRFRRLGLTEGRAPSAYRPPSAGAA